ncbi:MAG: hypothetical protein AAF404_00830 [Pseudomonadota bacterium]
MHNDRSPMSLGHNGVAQNSQPDDFAGAIALLRDCVGGVAGERLLIVSEPESTGYYDEQAPRLTAAAGRALGMRVYTTESDSFVNSEDEKAILIDGLRGFDHIVFFSRVGDQIRFTPSEEMPSSTMCYTLNVRSLNSAFGTACHHGMCEIKEAIDRAFSAAQHISVTCPQGTQYSGRPHWLDSPVEVGLKRFPLLVPRPVPADGLSGRIALSRFLIGTGNRIYSPYYLALPNVVFACVEDNRITGFEGDRFEVKRVEDHYKRVAEQLDIEPWHVDSWHSGIHPGCHFETDAESDILRWSGTAFGNPRILHFHTCGEYAPGEISWNLLDPTVELDGIRLWDKGRLHVDRLAEGAEILSRHSKLACLFNNPEYNIGLNPMQR